MTSSTSVTRMSAEEEEEDWGDDQQKAEDWGDDGDASGWGEDDIKEGEEWDASGQSDRVMLAADADAPSLSRQSSYRILDNESLLSTQNKLVAQNAEVLFVSPSEAALLLRHYGWKSKKLQAEWFENQKKVRETVGITSAEDGKASRAGVVNGRVQCQSAYCDEVDVSQAAALNCGHWFCSACWTAYLTSQINDGQKSVFTHCMGMRCELEHAHRFGCSCSELVPEAVFSKHVTDSRLLDKYRRWLLDSFVEGQRHIKWCPRPGCEYCVSYTSGGTKAIQCLCGFYFCFSCGEEAHTPAPCDLVKKWLLREKSDDATAIWLAAKTKECPKCGVRIEKNKACNHMTCIKCGHNFCWLCKGPWASHGNQTGGYYICIAQGTGVELVQGVSVPIETVQVGDLVHGLSDDSTGLTGRPVMAVTASGQRSCVELLFSDGRTLTCTPDHRILTADGVWTAAGDLVVGETEVSVGPTYPLESQRDARASDGRWKVDLSSSLGFVLSTTTPIGRARARAFARLVGAMLTHGMMTADGLQATLSLGHQLDVEAVHRDLATLGVTGNRLAFNVRCFAQDFPPSLCSAFTAVGVPRGERLDVVVSIPAVFTSIDCPTDVLRELLGGLFGGDGDAPSYNHSGHSFSPVRFSAHKTGRVAREQLAHWQSTLTPLLSRLGIAPANVHVDLVDPAPPQLTAADKEEQLSHVVGDDEQLEPTQSYLLRLCITADAQVQFADGVGFRYCAHKAMRLSAATAYFRAAERAREDRQLMQATATPLIAPRRRKGVNRVKEAVQQAVAVLQTTRTLLPETLCWLPGEMVAFNAAAVSAITARQALDQFGIRGFFSEKRKGKKYSAKAQAALLAAGQDDDDDDDDDECEELSAVASATRVASPSSRSHSSSTASAEASDLTDDAEGEVQDVDPSVQPNDDMEVDDDDVKVNVQGVVIPPPVAAAAAAAPAAAPASADSVRYGVPRELTAMPTFKVKLVGRRAVGVKKTFDVTVGGPAGVEPAFTAAGIVVHNCTKYDSDAKEGKVSSEERGMLDNQKLLQKYTYYYKRFKGSADAIKFTQKLGEKIEKNCRDEDLNKYSFLLEAVDKLIAARRILQWTYSLAYYLKNGGQKHLFEYQQEMLLNSTEALQDIMDNADMDRLMALKKDIINKTSSIDKFRQEMVAQVERGEFDELLLSHADIGMDSWTCVNCKADNKREQMHCQGCASCKLHGEYECKACKLPPK